MHDLSKYQRMMVCLDITEMDEHLIKYANMVVDVFGISHVYFYHVTTNFELPDDIKEAHPDLLLPVDELLEKDVEAKVAQWFTAPEGCEVKIHVEAGGITDEILKESKVKMIDLMLVGRKEVLTGSGLNSRKVAKATTASVIFVPENPSLKLNQVLVSIDYSEHSQMAFEIGIDIQKRSGAKLLSNNVYRVPVGYHKSGKSYEEFAEIMLQNTKNDCERFFRKIDLTGVVYDHTFALDDDPHPADKIYKTASELGVDMIILGSKGRTNVAAFLLGSVAEKLVMEDNDIPLFLIKKGKENLGFLEALFKL